MENVVIECKCYSLDNVDDNITIEIKQGGEGKK